MKKITKFLDSVMEGIKRTCVAKALAVFAVASIAINVNAQTTNEQAVITGIDQLTGISQDELLKNAITGTTFPTSDENKQFFLYNVGTGRFLNIGSYWGTHASLKQYGEPLAVIDDGNESVGTKSKKLQLIMEMNGTEGNFVGWWGVPATSGENHPNVGVYVDRKQGQVYGWMLEPTGDNKNTYRLRTYPHNQIDRTPYTFSDKKYYLCSNKGVVDADRNCEAYPEESLSQDKGYDEWRFISRNQIRALQEKNSDNLTDALELSFMLKCPGFSRGDNDIRSWHTYDFATEKLDVEKDKFVIYGLQKFNRAVIWPKVVDKNEESFTDSLPKKIYYPLQLKYSDPYTFDNVDYYKGDIDNYRCNLGKYYCASITNKRGIIFQDIEVAHTGTFKFECKGYSTTNKAALFAGVLDPTNPNKMVNNSLNRTILNQTSDMSPTVYDELHISKYNMDYAGKTFYSGNYNNVVYVTVPEETPKNDNGKYTIRVGIMIGEYKKDTKPETAGVGEWTVFDDFRMQYASRTYDEDLILDEERDNLTYLSKLKPVVTNKTLRLRKTFTVNKWNSFILPVNLTKKQVRETFGTDTRLAKLTGLTETAIEFTSVPLSGDNDLALKAYVPYLIFPTKAADQTPAYTAKYERNDGNIERLRVNIRANHYMVDKVSMPLTTTDGKYDFSQMDQDNWTSKTTNGSNDITAYGTFARTFDPGATQNPANGEWTYSDKKGTIIEGRDKLIGCYFFDKGNMYHSATRPRGLRGFSCWFKPGTKQNSVKLTLDGVTQDGTTGIEEILADYEQPVSRYANGIYNLNGQLVKQGNSTAGLPSGMYIVNGKKCIVR